MTMGLVAQGWRVVVLRQNFGGEQLWGGKVVDTFRGHPEEREYMFKGFMEERE